MELTAPAKINLYLKVIRRRDDGYHQIETIFERISIFDRITVEVSEDGTDIVCSETRVPTGGNSLLGRTVRMFREAAKLESRDFRIILKKNIPVGAGLGGGSSDAATLLKGLNELNGSPIGGEELLRLSRQLGADVPFFLSGYSFGIGKDRGDYIQKIETFADIWHVLVTAPFEISTAEVYNKITDRDLTELGALGKITGTFLIKNKTDFSSLLNCSPEKILHNDLQTIVLRDFPVLKQVFSGLKSAGAEGVLLSGSGSTVFGIFKQDEVEKAAERIRGIFPEQEGWKVNVAHTC